MISHVSRGLLLTGSMPQTQHVWKDRKGLAARHLRTAAARPLDCMKTDQD